MSFVFVIVLTFSRDSIFIGTQTLLMAIIVACVIIDTPEILFNVYV